MQCDLDLKISMDYPSHGRDYWVFRYKNSFAHKTGIPTTKEGWYRKIGRTIVRFFFK